jgi:hypothetical protein
MRAEDYMPLDREKFDEMLKDARRVERRENLSTFALCWFMDLSYPRRDLAAVLNIVECEKGWKS